MKQEKNNEDQRVEPISPRIMSYVKTVARDYFSSNIENVEVEQLAGGYGTAANFKLQVAGKAYVLRVFSELDSSLKHNTELHALKESANAGIGPPIHWISRDGYAILMDYIAGGTLTLEKGKKPRTISKVAELMRKIHALEKNPFHSPSFEAQMEEAYEQYSPGDPDQAIWEDAIAIIKEGESQLETLHCPLVNTHGDLNPRNILVFDDEVYFIDWGDGMYTDPFQDLAFFSIMMDYDSQEETYLMQCYLGHTPTMNERKRFQIAKKMNFGRLVLSSQIIGNQLNGGKKKETPVLEPHKPWSYYAKMFANDTVPLTAQFFWGEARVALQAANALEITDTA